MVQRSNDAALKDVQTMLRNEEYAEGMVQRSNYAAAMGAQIMLFAAEYVGGTEQSAMHKMHLLRLDQNSR